MIGNSDLWAGVKSRAICTGIKNQSFSHIPVFRLEVARQTTPKHCKKNLNKKTHLRSVVFWNSAGFSLFFCQCKTLAPLSPVLFGFFGHVGTWPSVESPAARDIKCNYVWSMVREKSRMRTTYQKTSMRFRFFSCQKTEKLWFFWQCKTVQQKTQVFWILFFANVNGPSVMNLKFG